MNKNEDLENIHLMRLPHYMEWSQRMLDEGSASEADIASLDATGILMRPSEVESLSQEYCESLFDEMLEDLQDESSHDPEAARIQREKVQEEKERTEAENLSKWLSDGKAAEFVAACNGKWKDRDCCQLVADLKDTEYWPISEDAVGAELEKATRELERSR